MLDGERQGDEALPLYSLHTFWYSKSLPRITALCATTVDDSVTLSGVLGLTSYLRHC